MPRYPEDQPLYEIIGRFRQQCLIEDRALLWPERAIWTLDNLLQWKERVVDHPHPDPNLSFAEKIELQLEGATPELWALTAEMLYLYYLPSVSIKYETKIGKIKWAATKGPYQLPEAEAEIWKPLQVGFCHTSYRYHVCWPQLVTLDAIAIEIKRSHVQREALFKDHKAFQRFVDTVIEQIPEKSARAYDFRHALLYLLFPEYYEPIISTQDKQKIVSYYSQTIPDDTFDTFADLDEKLLRIRQWLSENRFKGKAFDIYLDLKPEWDKEKTGIGGVGAKPSLPPIIDKATQLLTRFKNLVLYGPPGTGKTYWAKKIADSITEQNYIKWVTFHPSYAYEDFVEGLRPLSTNNSASDMVLEVVPGIFRRLCEQAAGDSQHTYILIIDEINRGNIAKIFGELMTLIEADKRDVVTVTLPYSQTLLRVPSNLLLIGTMNTADRSIALLDVALRRRFAFMEVLPQPELLDDLSITLEKVGTLNLGEFLRRLNEKITHLRGADYQIGHSYFLPLKDIPGDENKLAHLGDIWNYQVMPLLKEYFYAQPDLLRQILPGFFESVEDDQLTPPLLEGEDLLTALQRSLA